MKQKYKDVMIAMGIKIAALERVLKHHGEAHLAQDLTPQFRELCKKVDHVEAEAHSILNANYRREIDQLKQQMPYLKDYDIVRRITDLTQNLAAHHARMNRHDTRIAGLETAHNCQVTTNDDIFDKLREIGRDIKNLERGCYDLEKPHESKDKVPE
jgi:chromosome segregation ATPase